MTVNHYLIRSLQLARHSVVHTGQKGFQCIPCNRSYSQQASLNWHLRARHGMLPGIPSRRRASKDKDDDEDTPDEEEEDESEEDGYEEDDAEHGSVLEL